MPIQERQLSFRIIARNTEFAAYFALLYCSHLLLDWPDIDKKQYLWSFSKRKFSGFLPIWSRAEKAITLPSLIILAILYLN